MTFAFEDHDRASKVINLIITDRLHKAVIVGGKIPRLISMRSLAKKEVVLARKLGIRRYYMQSLKEAESAEFFKELDTFWDQVIKPFGFDHPFWRNAVSSKMQEWERSAAYLMLTLFAIEIYTPNLMLL